jgi:hypothetical protein
LGYFDQVCGLSVPFDIGFASKATGAGAGPEALSLAGYLIQTPKLGASNHAL